MKKVLLVWQMVPESVEWYAIPDPAAEELAALKSAHGAYINATATTPVQEAALGLINAAITSKDGSAEGFGPTERTWLHRWADYKVEEAALPELSGIDAVFTCGFLL
ncbi:hypothetical protein WK13_34980 [Burkholderia ubonensis]|uniref:hypothetical protein n=1 Tax=Burkholderia ubonensis TaxID=101571 RepID=UPI0007560C18|nr:hypothetical protein [Burkholderia ubonensis]KVR21745.1 hypothetical protein WK13_34980 [Burkholderia ubonensis]